MDAPLLDQAIAAARKCGAAEAEAVFTRARHLDIDVAEGEVETLASSESIGLGIRLFTGDKRLGFAYTTALDEGVDTVVQAAWQNAQASAPDEYNGLPDETLVSEEDWCVVELDAVPVAQKIALAQELEAKTRAADNRIARVQEASYSDATNTFCIANSRGRRRSCRTNYCSCSVVAAASQPGMDDEMGAEFDFARAFDALRLDWVAEQCALRAVRRLGGKPCATGAVPVVFDNRVATSILQVLGPALNAEQVLKGKSLFADKLGTRVAGEAFSLVDENDRNEGLHRSPFDGEGTSAQRTALIENGTLHSYLHNTYTARKMDAATTANASRAGFRSAVGVGASNAYLLPGDTPPEALFQEAGTGLFVTQAMGVHTANPISGDFSFGATGLRIEQGVLGAPVRGVTIAGNIKDLLGDVQAVANDLRFFGTYGAPSMLVARLMVSGT